MEAFSVWDAFVVSEVAELGEDVARLWRQCSNLVHKEPPALKFGTHIHIYTYVFLV